MRRVLLALAGLALLGGGAFYVLTIPRGLSAAELAAVPDGDAGRGERIFWAGGCASCHAAEGAKGDERFRLGGGRVLKTDFGDFVVPNISNDATDGIGGWSAGDLANAMLRGVSPEGRPFYPSFPYTSYARMDLGDIADLRAYLATLPGVAGRQPDHDLRFPFSIRRGLGLWQRAFLSSEPVLDLGDAVAPEVKRGQYLVEGPGHCGECHTPRGVAGQPEYARWLGGAPAAEGGGKVPNITPGGDLGDWSASDIAYYLESGFTPDYDSVGGSMVEVQENMAMLPAEDREAIAAYLGVVPSVEPAR
jgi:mono/diheme cytochrome c family protein